MLKEKMNMILLEKNQSIKANQMRHVLKNAQQKRKADFKTCCRAYYNVIDYLGVRSEGVAAVLPSREEISFLEVFHTLI